MDTKLIAKEGNYTLLETDSFYQSYSGYAYVVCFQSSPFMMPKQLKGFTTNELDKAKKYFNSKVSNSSEQKQYDNLKNKMHQLLSDGYLPVEHGDIQEKAAMFQKGATEYCRDNTYVWYKMPLNG